jgi:hypothetical protein
MRLLPTAINRFAAADRRFDQFTQKFAGFVARTLDYFSEQRCPVRGVLVTRTDDPLAVIVTYRTVTLGIHMLCELTHEGAASGRVLCTLEKPSFSKEKRLLGSFSFNSQGITDFEADEGDDPIDLEYMAPEIVLTLLHQALQLPAV